MLSPKPNGRDNIPSHLLLALWLSMVTYPLSQGLSVLYANRHVRTWEIRMIFLKMFSYKWEPFIVLWLNIVCANLFLSVDISLLLRIVFTLKIKKVWGVECDKFETFFTIHCVFRKNEGDWGNSCKHICRHKESTLTDYHFFQDFSGKFFHSKAVDFSNFLSLYKCRKILTIKTTLMSLN